MMVAEANIAEIHPVVRKRLVLITGYPVGFGAIIYHAVNGIYFSLATGRVPFVFWDSHRCLYVDRSRGPLLEHNYFEDFFEPVSCARLSDFSDRSLVYYPSVWNRDNIVDTTRLPFNYEVKNNAECVQGFPTEEEILADVVVFSSRLSVYDLIKYYPPPPCFLNLTPLEIIRKIVHEYLRLKQPIVANLKARHKACVGSKPYIAVHIRATDKVMEYAVPHTSRFISSIRIVLQKNPSLNVFIATDSLGAFSATKSAFNDRLCFHDVERSVDARPVHSPYGNGQRRALEFLQDCYSAARGSVFIGTSHSALVWVMRDVVGEAIPKSEMILVNPSFFDVLLHKKAVLIDRTVKVGKTVFKRLLPDKVVTVIKYYKNKFRTTISL
ncbi:MAG: hypothetical protein ACFUZC_12485 [Chthoniobacteraceae bacterium]